MLRYVALACCDRLAGAEQLKKMKQDLELVQMMKMPAALFLKWWLIFLDNYLQKSRSRLVVLPVCKLTPF